MPERAPPFRLTVENLGPIAEATVEVRPITLFVGENNTGKTYLSSAIFALTTLKRDEWRRRLMAHPRIQAELTAIVSLAPVYGAAAIHERYAWFRAGGLEPAPEGVMRLSEQWRAWAEQVANGSAEKAVRDLFGEAAVDCRVRVDSLVCSSVVFAAQLDDQDPPKFCLMFDLGEGPMGIGEVLLDQAWLDGVPIHGEQFRARAELAEKIATTYLGWPPPEAEFVPASRSSFLHLYRALIAHLLDPSAGDRAGFALSLPLRSFALGLNRAEVANPIAQDLAEALEHSVLRGRVVMASAWGHQFSYQPEGTTLNLDSQRSSSVVTETAPLVQLLRQQGLPKLLIVEEPEAHLHPRLQRVLARVLVRLANRGVKLIISTHSDLFAQQINNCLKLGAAKATLNQKDFAALCTQLGVDAEEALVPEDVAGYEFRRAGENGATQVVALQVKERGVVMPLFNEELHRINEEMDILDDALAGVMR